MVEPQLLLELLMCLFTNPSCFDGSGEHRDSGIGRQVRYIVFLLSGRPPFADEPDLIAGHALHTIIEHAVLMAIRKSDTAGGEVTGQRALGSLSPTNLSPFLSGQHRLGGNRRPVGNMVFAALSSSCDGEDQGDVGWIDVLAARQPHRP